MISDAKSWWGLQFRAEVLPFLYCSSMHYWLEMLRSRSIAERSTSWQLRKVHLSVFWGLLILSSKSAITFPSLPVLRVLERSKDILTKVNH